MFLFYISYFFHLLLEVAFPDDGAAKRFGKMFGDTGRFEVVICGKHREGESGRVITIMEGDPSKGKHVVIVDDLVQSGGTLFECAVALKKRGCPKVSTLEREKVEKGKWGRGGDWVVYREAGRGGESKGEVVKLSMCLCSYAVADVSKTYLLILSTNPIVIIIIIILLLLAVAFIVIAIIASLLFHRPQQQQQPTTGECVLCTWRIPQSVVEEVRERRRPLGSAGHVLGHRLHPNHGKPPANGRRLSSPRPHPQNCG
jgi:hypothetical protein